MVDSYLRDSTLVSRKPRFLTPEMLLIRVDSPYLTVDTVHWRLPTYCSPTTIRKPSRFASKRKNADSSSQRKTSKPVQSPSISLAVPLLLWEKVIDDYRRSKMLSSASSRRRISCESTGPTNYQRIASSCQQTSIYQASTSIFQSL